MGTFKTIDEARRFFTGDHFATDNGMRIDELFDGGCVCSMELDERHANAYGGVMGGVIFTLGDFAFAVSSNNDHQPTVALNVSASFLSRPKGKRLTARSECVKSGRTTAVYEVTISDDTGRNVALFVCTGYKLEK